MKYEAGKYYAAEIIAINKVEFGKDKKEAVEIGIRLASGDQDSLVKQLSGGAVEYIRKMFVSLGCEASDLTGNDWLVKIRKRLLGTKVSAKAEDEGDYGVRIGVLFRAGNKVVADGISPFGGSSVSSNEFGIMPSDEGPANPW